MNKAKIAFLLLSIVILFTGCEKNSKTTDEKVVREVPHKIFIHDLDEAWDAILTQSTKEFIGNHPVDEGFLSYITGIYGESVVERIASFAEFTTPSIWRRSTGKSIHVLWYEYCNSTGVQSYGLDKTYCFDTKSSQEIVLDFTGDLTFADDVATTQYMEKQPGKVLDCFSSNLIDEMQGADVMVANNEFAYTKRGRAIPGKAYTFRADPSRVDYLGMLGIDVVGIANNHVYDYDFIGFSDTIDTLESAKMPYIGAGRDINEASKPIYIIAGGRKIALVAATQIERSYNYTKEATEKSGGVLKCLEPSRFCEEIRLAKQNSDYCIVFVHWGTEGNEHYGADQISLANAFVNSGADVIIGGHTHCLQTVEYIGDVPVFYSLGNYYFSTTTNMPNAYDSGLAQIRIRSDGSIQPYFLPCRFDSGVTTLLSKDDNANKRIINNLNELSETATISSEGYVMKK